MTFRGRLLATIRAARPVLEVPDVLVVGSEVPNLLEPCAAATLVVSLGLDIGVPVTQHAAVKHRLPALLEAFTPSAEELSVWTPWSPDLLEVNFVGIDRTRDPADAYVFEDDQLPLLVFGALSLIEAGAEIELADTRPRLPRPAGLLLEKLVTDRTGEKGGRDLLVALGLLMMASTTDLDELGAEYRRLRPELRHAVRSDLTVLSLLDAQAAMPDPRPRRPEVADVLRRLLTDASAAFAISDDEARALVAEGLPIEAVGRAQEPPKVIVFAPADRVRQLASARPVPVRLGRELLEADHLVLVRF